MPDPIMNAGFYLKNPQGRRRAVYDENGERRWEKLPSSAGRKRHRAILRDDGHIVLQPLTSHSANLDLESKQANYYRKKARNLGWLPTAECPVVLAMSNQINPRALCDEVQKAVDANKGCARGSYSEEKPCKHLLAEEAARKARRKVETERREAAHRSEQDRLLEAQRDTQKATAEAMHRMADIVQGLKGDDGEAPAPAKTPKGQERVRELNDIELRDATIRDYKRGAERSGIAPDMGAIEKLVLQDLTLVDNYEKEQAGKPKPKKVKKERDVRTDELDRLCQEENLKVYTDETPREYEKDRIADAKPVTERAVAMFRRIRQIMSPRGDIVAAARKNNDLLDVIDEFMAPKLSREFLEQWTWYMPLRAVMSPKNPYYWLNDGDAAMKFVRALEDICDRSTGQFGPWWVK